MSGLPIEVWRERRLETLRLRREAIPASVSSYLPSSINVAAIRTAMRDGYRIITQEEFARRFGFSAAAVRDWEQGRRKPDRSASILLLMIKHDSAIMEGLIRAAIVRRGEGVESRPSGRGP